MHTPLAMHESQPNVKLQPAEVSPEFQPTVEDYLEQPQSVHTPTHRKCPVDLSEATSPSVSENETSKLTPPTGADNEFVLRSNRFSPGDVKGEPIRLHHGKRLH
eukprot:GHVU01080246.1.p2 GENE.GHVU01080246.1~~GHVU01080246.1.p2  ORF type:complete len:104 (-),score=11.23 GHVU01080246.1:1100-1411(-)